MARLVRVQDFGRLMTAATSKFNVDRPLGFCLVPFAPSPVGGRIAMSMGMFGAVLAGMGFSAAIVNLIVRRKRLLVGLWWIALMANVESCFVAQNVVGDFQNVHVLNYLEETYPIGPFCWPLIFGFLFAAPLATMILFALAFVRFAQGLLGIPPYEELVVAELTDGRSE